MELPRKWKVVFIGLTGVLVVSLGGIGAYGLFLQDYRAKNAAARDELVKSDDALIGQRMMIERVGKDAVPANIYYPDARGDAPLPVVFNIHGGGFVGGDADVLDTQSDRIANEWRSIVVTINYTKADVKPISYGSEQIKDAVLYFSDNASSYQADASKFSIMGYSAGAYYALDAARLLEESSFRLSAVVLSYPWLTGYDKSSLSKDYPPLLFVLAGQDPISERSKPYYELLKSAGADVDMLNYPDAVHSFIESNNPEGRAHASAETADIISPTQEALAREAESDIHMWLSKR